MKKHVFVALGLATILMSGCLTQSIQQGKDLSTSGIAYTEAVDKLLDATTDRVIDFDTKELIKSRRGSDPMGMITQKNEELSNLLTQIGKFRSQTKLLKTYFLNLQALADSPVKDDAGGAVHSLSDSISKLNEALGGKDGKENLTEDEKKQIGALGGLVANTIHAAKIKRALARDAEVIWIYLGLQEDQIENITGILRDRFLAENDLFLNEKVIAPYVDKSQSLGTEWANDRKQWIKIQFVSQQLVTAKEAAKQLRGIWVDILQGKTDIKSLSVLISDVNEFVTTVQALEAAGNTN
jgi:hypothetical protein